MGTSTLGAVFGAITEAITRQAKLIGIAAAAIVGAFALASLFFSHPLATFLKLLSFTGLALMAVSVAITLLTFRCAKQVVPAALIAALATTLVSTALIYWSLYGRPTPAVAVLSLIAGGGLGYAWSRTTVFFLAEGRLKMRGTLWYLAVWLLTLAINQTAVLIAGHSPAILQCLALAGAGLAAGNTAGLLLAAHKAAGVLHLEEGARHV